MGIKKAELLAEISFVKYAHSNFSTIMMHDDQRVATIASLQAAKKIAMKNIEFYLNDLAMTSKKKPKDYQELCSLTDKAMRIKDSIEMSRQLYVISKVNAFYDRCTAYADCSSVSVDLHRHWDHLKITGEGIMVPKKIKCKNCAADIEVKTWRKFVKCPYCSSKFSFEGFDYEEIDWSGSMYSAVKLWMDCPACRSKNMYLGPSGRTWKCPDCGYTVSKKEKRTGVFWFCDDCEAYLNVQPGFTTANKTWTCTECGHVNGVTKDNII